MGFSFDVSVPVITVFIQGLLSFFSPCVLPLIPLYIGYLSGGTRTVGDDGKIYYSRKKVFVNTIFFVIGVSFTFFALGLGVSALGSFFQGYQEWFARIGGILIVIFGLYQLGVFGKSKVLGSEHRLPFQLDRLAMSPWTALIMGFTFSFAWTPCVGPALSSVLLMAASAGTKMTGLILIGIYTLGFVLPFLAVGAFSATLLDVFKKHRNIVRYTVKVGGVLMILMGVMMFTGKMNAITGYLSKASVVQEKEVETQPDSDADSETDAGKDSDKQNGSETEKGNSAGKGTEDKSDKTGSSLADAFDFELKDQYGNVHKLEDYKGKVIFLNFWATWCPPCRAEMPDIQKLYEEFEAQENSEVVILGVAAPGYSGEESAADVGAFLEENGYTYPVLLNEGGSLFDDYMITSFPTTYMITAEGKVFGYVRGQLSEDVMRSIIAQTLNGQEKSE